ncbi:MAG: RNA polymerase sigma factor [bacterium]
MHEVIRDCQKGDLRAFESIYRHFEQSLLNLGLRMLGKKEDAEDAVQMAFLKLYRGIKNFRFNAKFSTYLFRIMMNCCFDALQKRKRDSMQNVEDLAFVYTPNVDLKLQIEDAIEKLPERMRACFVLFAIQGMKQEDIANIMNLSVGAVKSHVFQAKAKLRVLLTADRTLG